MSDRRVFVLEPTRHDLKDATRYGDIVYLYERDERRPGMWTNAFIEDCTDRLNSYGYAPEIDYFLIGGPSTPVTLLSFHLVATFEAVNFLLFDAVQSEYVHKLQR